jgi:radical SAM superfamily enzyme YgiQ (UPF0313 family)
MSFNQVVYENVDFFVKKLKEANFYEILIGFESGSEHIRKEILKRPAYTNDAFIDFCEKIQKTDILLSLYVLLGLPYETKRDINTTIDVVERIDPYLVIPSVFTPYPGTDIHKFMVDKKMINNKFMFTGWEERIKLSVKYKNLSGKIIKTKLKYLQDKYGCQRRYKRNYFVNMLLKK